eukprot:3783638-Prymnesium_polylepis.1
MTLMPQLNHRDAKSSLRLGGGSAISARRRTLAFHKWGSVGSHHHVERKLGDLAFTLTDAEASPGAVALTCPERKSS